MRTALRTATMPSFESDSEEPVAEVKKEKRDKKPKRKSKSTNENDDVQADTQADAAKSKKRKRDALPEEIEIDVNLPEPASKKAARKAKKAKTQPTAATNGTADTTTKTEQTENGEAKEHPGKRSEYSVWVGNLPWSATKDTLREFFTTHSEIKSAEITRIHMPAPAKPPRPNWHSDKPHNKGFAYVDFSTQLAMYAAIALTETKLDNRALLIKNAKNFEGRPDKPKADDETDNKQAQDDKKPSKKVFVGNLGFETSREDLEAHFSQCGAVTDLHMATFEDTGKCKGFAWVTFEDIEAATAAVRGYVYRREDGEQDGDEGNEGAQTHGKKRKFRLNKLMGRDLRCEFAEDSTTRYQKRYGKEKKGENVDGIIEEDGEQRPRKEKKKPYALPGKLHKDNWKKKDPRSIRPGAAHANAPRASAAIVESKGKKTTFD